MMSEREIDEVRAAWQEQPVMPIPVARAQNLSIAVEQIDARARQAAGLLTRARYATILGLAIYFPIAAWVVTTLDTGAERFGLALATIGALSLAFQVNVHVSRVRADMARVDAQPTLDAYLALLERHRAFFIGRQLWLRMLTLFPALLIAFGIQLREDPHDSASVAGMGVVLILALAMYIQSHRQARPVDEDIREARVLAAEMP